MAKRVTDNYTFGRLSRALRSIGFALSRQGDHIVLTHSSGRPEILLPAYSSGEVVRPIHLMMIKKQLTDAGLLEPGQVVFKTHRKRAAHSKS